MRTPSARVRTSIRCGLAAPAPARAAATSGGPRPTSSATVAAASALVTWCSPTSARRTGTRAAAGDEA